MKKAIALFMALSLSLSLSMTACGGSGGSADGSTVGSGGSGGEGVSFTIFNSKTEIQEYLEEAAAKYSEENGVDIEVYYSNDTVAAHLSVKYASNEPYTLAMTDAKDIYTLAVEHGYDMSGQDLDKLVADGMEAPTAILKPDWSPIICSRYLRKGRMWTDLWIPCTPGQPIWQMTQSSIPLWIRLMC